MSTIKSSHLLHTMALILSAIALLSSCGLRNSKGSVYEGLSKGIRVGMDRSEVIKYVDSIELNGVKPVRSEYWRDTSLYPVVAPDGASVRVEGIITTEFDNGVSGNLCFCSTVWVIFYFDDSDKLITYHIDC